MVELYVSETDVWYQCDGRMSRLTESDPMVGQVLQRIEELYPDAYKALSECYEKSIRNTPYYNYLRARRFCKCNFGALDHTKEDVGANGFNFERVPCPLRGECKYEGVICMPKIETALSEAEKRVMRLVYNGLSNVEIADELFISINTVKRHIYTSFIKCGVKCRAEFVRYANDNNIFV